jgi:SWI/SNF-related matrix-associated actin-dependent regulator of chromatin subfamily D
MYILKPQQFKLDPRLTQILGLTTATRPAIIQALWQYIKTHKLQSSQEKEFIQCDRNLKEVGAHRVLLHQKSSSLNILS